MKNALDNYTELLLFRVKTDEDLSFARLEELLESWYLLRRSIEPREDARAVEGAGPYEGEAEGSTLGEEMGEAFREGFQNFEPVAPPAKKKASAGVYGPQAVMKRKTLERVEQLRAAGRRAADFLTASGGALSASELDAMLRREKVPFRAWEALAKACEQMEGETE